MDIPIPTQEAPDIPVPAPLTTAGYGGGGAQAHILHHHHQQLETDQHTHHAAVVGDYGGKSNNNTGSTNGVGGGGSKVGVRYRECMKNHAAAMGGTAMDGCGEFMPSGEEGSIEALTCSACGCHRNFHRKEVEGGGDYLLEQWPYHHHSPPHLNRVGRKVIVGHPHHHHKNLLGGHEAAAALLYPSGALIASRGPTPHQMILPYGAAAAGQLVASESDEQEEVDGHHHGHGHGGGGGPVAARPTQMVKKRFRTKFSQEQKEKMMSFSEKVGWKIQRQEESVVQQFCQEIGVKRRVLKVWMHNNKHTLAKKNNNIISNNNLNINPNPNPNHSSINTSPLN